jgi:hypothetical protein
MPLLNLGLSGLPTLDVMISASLRADATTVIDEVSLHIHIEGGTGEGHSTNCRESHPLFTSRRAHDKREGRARSALQAINRCHIIPRVSSSGPAVSGYLVFPTMLVRRRRTLGQVLEIQIVETKKT